jgi:8-amino-7-oxononanoate synthase
LYDLYCHYLSKLQNSGKLRQLPAPSPQGHGVWIDFTTNDYLGLSHNPEALNAADTAGKLYGVGATGSRLLSGNNALFEAFEAQIARDKHTESALIFNSGFQANVGALSALLDQHVLQALPLVFFDKLNHASLYQAAFLSGAELIRYRHNDMNHLEALLKKHCHSTRPKFIVTETVFGMDGDIAPLQDLVALTSRYGALLYLDEAHATGVFGPHGYGISTTVNLTDIPHVIMGTFSKAVGSSGGYIACSHLIKNYLVNTASGFIYSTAPSPIIIGAAAKGWEMLKSLDQERHNLQELAAYTRTQINNLGFNTGYSHSHIIPLIIGEENHAVSAQAALRDKGVNVSCIRPPTVPPKTARLRIALTTSHGLADIERLMEALKTL